MDNLLVKRMNTVSKVGKIITLVIIIIAIIATTLIAAGAVALSVLPKDIVTADISAQTDIVLNNQIFNDVKSDIISGVNENAGEVYDAGSAVFRVNADETDDNAVLHVDADQIHVSSDIIIPALWIVFFNCVAFIVCAFFFKSLMGELAVSSSPFTEGVVKKMQNFAIAILMASVATSIANGILGAILTSGHAFSFSLHFGSIITAAIIFVLVTVFRYGAQLQKESDETL